MAITAYKTYIAGEVLSASDLNASLTYITTNALAMISPLTGTLDCDGQILILDSDGDSSLQAASDDVLTLKLNNASLFVWNGATASVVNGVTMTAAIATAAPVIAATGTDTNIDLELRSKGTGDVVVADASGEEIAVFADVASAVNELQVTNAATGNPVLIEATGDDTNIGITLTTKGTGTTAVSGSFRRKTGADVASASALAVGIAGNQFDVTGTTTITSIDTKGIGAEIVLQFDGALTLTHHTTDLILPGSENITTAAGDVAIFWEYDTGKWRCLNYQRLSISPTYFDAYSIGKFDASGATVTFAASGLPRLLRIDIDCYDVSTDSADQFQIQVGDAIGGFAGSGYEASGSAVSDAVSPTTLTSTTGFPVLMASASAKVSGRITLVQWHPAAAPSGYLVTCSGTLSRYNSVSLLHTAGRIQLTSDNSVPYIDRIRADCISTAVFDGSGYFLVRGWR